jgi:hypothetical protein
MHYLSRNHTYETEDGWVTEKLDVDWQTVRMIRDLELQRTDFWALKDLTMSQAKKDYRIFLRELPQNFETANEAADAYEAYEKPE